MNSEAPEQKSSDLAATLRSLFFSFLPRSFTPCYVDFAVHAPLARTFRRNGTAKLTKDDTQEYRVAIGYHLSAANTSLDLRRETRDTSTSRRRVVDEPRTNLQSYLSLNGYHLFAHSSFWMTITLPCTPFFITKYFILSDVRAWTKSLFAKKREKRYRAI